MDIQLKQQFLDRWHQYFGDAPLPVVFWYSDNIDEDIEDNEPSEGWSCFIGDLAKVRNGRSIAFNREAIGCGGGRRYLGFDKDVGPGFEYFLSCGNEEIKGERYLRTPGLVKKFLENAPYIPASASRIVFKRWDKLVEGDLPEVVIFFASPDVLSGLFTLSGYDRGDLHGSVAPFGSGCASIIQYPLAERREADPRGIIGMFDVSARPFVPAGTLSFAVPFERFTRMVHYMDESFLVTEDWDKVKKRINKQKPE